MLAVFRGSPSVSEVSHPPVTRRRMASVPRASGATRLLVKVQSPPFHFSFHMCGMEKPFF